MRDHQFKQLWQGRTDPEGGAAGLRLHQHVQPYSSAVAPGGITLVGLASDLGVQYNLGRTGAREGPPAIRRCLANLAWHDTTPCYDAGDIEIEIQADREPLQTAQRAYAGAVYNALCNQQFVIGLGGGHEIAWGSYQGARHYLDHCGKERAVLGILNFDAHFDLRTPPDGVAWQGSSGTPFYQVSQDCQDRDVAFEYACIGISRAANTRALFDFAASHNVNFVLDDECAPATCAALVADLVAKVDALYVTVCLDALPGDLAPGVSAPAALGVSLTTVLDTLKYVKHACAERNVKWLMLDVAEMNPSLDQDNRTARVAARLIYEVMNLTST
ncbi:formimidoylglutamase [Arenicella chitinivorans]|uniref:Formimidoylglutamase n=1 Tax=Arenicella chitinivorans TaxID=1329800 RepID=A0A918VHW4_9GAMM|nr:formimidoylglutamase [Arenicella chitinivorans]GGZ97474.1 formimidoylglutamase [Arenicella chitinivorans]